MRGLVLYQFRESLGALDQGSRGTTTKLMVAVAAFCSCASTGLGNGSETRL